MITKHVSILTEGMCHSAEVKTATSFNEFKTIYRQLQPDIVHGHGCWLYMIGSAANFAIKNGSRFILSPHGQLEPWIFEDKPFKEKINKTLLWQKKCVANAYALIAFGKMEYKHLNELKWNNRIEVIHNSLITNSISIKEMCSQTFSVYQKVLDSNVLELMSKASQHYLSLILKASITGDRRWIQEEGIPSTRPDWRQILIYADHENIRNFVDYGMSIMQIPQPTIDTSKIAAYFPNNFRTPQPIKDIVGEYNGNETDFLIRIILQLAKSPTLLNLVELSRELRRDNVRDDKLQEALQEKGLYKFASRLMQILSEQTLLEEGYMPLPPTDDRGTKQIRTQLANHLKL